MARPRIRQFAGDMGISYDDAENLIKKGRGRRDGGSQVLESNMKKMRGFDKGGTNKMTRPTPLSESDKRYREYMSDPDIPDSFKEAVRENPSLIDPDHPMNTEGRGTRPTRPTPKPPRGKRGEVYAASGKYMSCRGMGAAIKGNKFTGVK
tara:strand:- start:459 stop:908 length:450 start_codon:yes stop_codon:yes gene_type:complete